MRQSFTDFTKRYVGDSRCAIVHEKITDNTGLLPAQMPEKERNL